MTAIPAICLPGRRCRHEAEAQPGLDRLPGINRHIGRPVNDLDLEVIDPNGVTHYVDHAAQKSALTTIQYDCDTYPAFDLSVLVPPCHALYARR